MSGGVDSSVTAALLKEGGFDVYGVHIKMWSDPDIPCNFKEDRYDAMRVAVKLDIPFETWDFTKEYKEAVVNYMIREYGEGRTPNPDVMCNQHIKFGIFLASALERGADFVATGHYVRRVPPGMSLKDTQKFPSEEFFSVSSSLVSRTAQLHARSSEKGLLKTCPLPISLLKANDTNKDQSYFLWTLNQNQLQHCLFPIGEYTKPEVRELAKKFNLPTAEKEESQGICFIGEINIRDFLKKYIPVKPGKVLTTSGKIVGEHEGLNFFTMGQREGLGIGGGIPYYVVSKDFINNALIVAEGPYDEKLFKNELEVTDINWISGKEPKFPFRYEARIRYRQPVQRCRVERQVTSNKRQGLEACRASHVTCRFDEPQRAVTPGQSVVFYKGEEMLGGGIII